MDIRTRLEERKTYLIEACAKMDELIGTVKHPAYRGNREHILPALKVGKVALDARLQEVSELLCAIV